MDQPLDFIKEFIAADHEVQLAKCSERDNERYRLVREIGDTAVVAGLLGEG